MIFEVLDKSNYSLSFRYAGKQVFKLPFVKNVEYAIKWTSRNVKDKNGTPLRFNVVWVFNRKTNEYLGYIRP